ncbi:MAG: DNA polymerase IV [Clostridiales bacterium]|nr:DNA polymerase IV [Clostridiales bacterium]
MPKKCYFHVDVNSAFLAWEAAWRIQHGDPVDIREIPSVVGGTQATRHGIVLAKSTLAKKLYKAQTGESIFGLKQRAPNILVVPPRHGLYEIASQAFIDHLSDFSPKVERFSVDEAFVEYTGLEKLYGEPEQAAKKLSASIKQKLGFTVNIGISSNKLLAKMAGELEKPDKVHTIWPEEVPQKMWPLPIGELYMVGRKTEEKLKARGIFTIGDLARCKENMLRSSFKSQGSLLWNFANGRCFDTGKAGAANFQGMLPNNKETINAKGLGNSTTIAFDVEDMACAHRVLLSLSETVGSRLRENGYRAKTIHVSYATSEFKRSGKQKTYHFPCASTTEIFSRAVEVFDSMWSGEPMRQMGVWTGGFSIYNNAQVSMFSKAWKQEAVDNAIDKMRKKYGNHAAFRAVFLNSDIRHMIGGTASLRNFPYGG